MAMQLRLAGGTECLGGGVDLAEDDLGGSALVAHEFAEQQVVGLDAGGAFVDGGDARSRQCWAAPVSR